MWAATYVEGLLLVCLILGGRPSSILCLFFSLLRSEMLIESGDQYQVSKNFEFGTKYKTLLLVGLALLVYMRYHLFRH